LRRRRTGPPRSGEKHVTFGQKNGEQKYEASVIVQPQENTTPTKNFVLSVSFRGQFPSICLEWKMVERKFPAGRRYRRTLRELGYEGRAEERQIWSAAIYCRFLLAAERLFFKERRRIGTGL
jgi:hypothetical protein